MSAIAGKPQPGDDPFRLGGGIPAIGGDDRSAATAYSIKPRRIALATAAARSETPSFSYRC